MKDLGIVEPGSTVYIEFDSFGADGQSITLTGLAVTDVEIYRDGSVTQRSSDAGISLLDTDGIDFDGVTGIHGLSIDLSDNTDLGFYRAGSHYRVVISSVTINTQTVNFTQATFRIGYRAAILNTTIASVTSPTVFTLTSGPAEADALNGQWAIIHDVASAVQKCVVQILDYAITTKEVTLVAGATFTVAATDNFSWMGPMPLQPTTTGRTLTIETDGMAHADVKEVGGTVPTLASSVDANVVTIASQTASAAGAVTFPGTIASPTNITAGTITTAINLTNLPTIPTNWLTAAGTAADFGAEIQALITGGAYTLSTDANGRIRIVDGTGTGEFDSFSGGVLVFDFTTAAKALLQTEAEDALVVHRLDELLNADSDIDGAAPPTLGSVFHELMSGTGGSFTFDQTTDSLEALRNRGDAAWATGTTPPTVGAIADAVWDEAIAGHIAAGSTGEALTAAGAAGDPWITSLPGAYIAGSAGHTIGTFINATVSSRATQTSVDDLPTNAELAVAFGTADDAVLTAIASLNNLSQANIRTAIGMSAANLDTQLGSLPTAAQNASALLDLGDGIETVHTPV